MISSTSFNPFLNAFFLKISQITNPIPQLQQTGGHQMGPPAPQGPPNHMTQVPQTASHIPPQQGAPQITQPGPPNQIGIPQVPQSHMGPAPTQIGPGAHGPPGQVVGLPPQMGPQQQSTMPGHQGPSMQPHVSNTPISSQGSGTIQVPPGTTTGTILANNPTMQGPHRPGVPQMQGMGQVTVSQRQPSLQFPPPTSLPTATNETPRIKEDAKPETAELISFD